MIDTASKPIAQADPMGDRRPLEGRSAIVTGSTSGIGLGIAKALAQSGAAVMLNGSAAYAADPCSLLTPEQVATALGVPEVKMSPAPAAKRCGWQPKKYTPGGSKQVHLQLEEAKLFDMLKKHPIGVTPVTGIGDEALQHTTKTSTVLQVRKGNVVFAVSVSGLPLEQASMAEQQLAKYALSKL